VERLLCNAVAKIGAELARTQVKLAQAEVDRDCSIQDLSPLPSRRGVKPTLGRTRKRTRSRVLQQRLAGEARPHRIE
jgi:hypothetical protein